MAGVKMGGIPSGIFHVIYICPSSFLLLLLLAGTEARLGQHGTPTSITTTTGEMESCSLQTSTSTASITSRFSPAVVSPASSSSSSSASASRLQQAPLEAYGDGGGGGSGAGNKDSGGSGGTTLICQIRTLHSDLNLTSLLSVPNRPEAVVKLKLICNDLLFFESVLQSGQLRPFSSLEELEIDRCKLRVLRERSFQGLARLRRLSIRTGNAEWPARSLEISAGALSGTSPADLHLGSNNIRSLPWDFFCQVGHLQTLNLTHNLLSNINDLGLVESGNRVGPGATTPAPSTPCGSDLKSLDLSFNAIQTLGKFHLPSLQTLRLDHNRLEELQPGSFSPLLQLRSLNLSSNSLFSLPVEAFTTSRHLRELYLQNNSLSELRPGLFTQLESLHTLDLSHNQLFNNWMSMGTFEHLRRLVILKLAGNQLSRVQASTFAHLHALQLLDLSDNLITTIEDGSFSTLENLHSLNLAQNRLSVVTAATFTGLRTLHRLLLDYNGIASVHPAAFHNSSSSLQDVGLVRNKLESVPGALRNLAIRSLDLGENRITRLQPDSLDGLTQLYGLRLVGNHIEEIPKQFCQFTPRLRALNLAQNRISRIELSAFAGCPQLKVLRLDSNQLSTLPPTLSAELPALLWLNMSANELTFLDYTALPPKLEWLDMSHNRIHSLWGRQSPGLLLQHLRILDLGHNNVSRIDHQSFPIFLQVVRLPWNGIEQVGADTFSGLGNLRKVELNDNALAQLELKALRLGVSEAGGRSLTEFYVAGNPFTCDCDMEWLTRVNSLSSLRSHPFIVDLDSIVCHLQLSRFGHTRPLIEMRAQDFLCSYNSHCFALCHCCEFDACDCQMTCPDGCTCYHDDTWTANVVDCAGGNHSVIPARLPMDSTEVYLDGNWIPELRSHGFIGRKNLRVLYLNSSGLQLMQNKSFNGLHSLQLLQLAGNSLSILHGYEFEQLGRLKELYLRDNRLRYISNNTFLPLKSLEVLDLAGNLLVTFKVWQLALNRNLMVISMGRNSWDCECEFLQQLDRWAMENAARISDAAELRCLWNRTGKVVPGPLVRDYNLTCVSTWALIQQGILPVGLEPWFLYVCAALALLLLVSSVLAVVMLSESVQYRIFWATGGVRLPTLCSSHSGGGGAGCCCCSSSSSSFNGDSDSEKCVDAYFVYSEADAEFLRKRIVDELEDNGGYRLTLHYRDVETNSESSMQIAMSTARTLVILLSPNFFHREWANVEFRQRLLSCLQPAPAAAGHDKSTDTSSAHGHKSSSPSSSSSSSGSRRTLPTSILLVLKDEGIPTGKINSDFLTLLTPPRYGRRLRPKVIPWSGRDFWYKFKFYLGEPRQKLTDHSDCTSTSYTYSRHLPDSSASSVYKPSTPSVSLRSPRPEVKGDILTDRLWPYASTHLVPMSAAAEEEEAQPEPPPHFQEILRRNNFNLNNYATYLSQMSHGNGGCGGGGTSPRSKLYAGRPAYYGTVNSAYSPAATKSHLSSSSPLSSSATTTESTIMESDGKSDGALTGLEQHHQFIYCNGHGAGESAVEEEPEHVYFSLERTSISPRLIPSTQVDQQHSFRPVATTMMVQCESRRPGGDPSVRGDPNGRRIQTFLV